MNTTKMTSRTELTASKFFSLNGKYQVAPSTTGSQLHDDIGCWLESIHGTVHLIAGALQQERGGVVANPLMVARAMYGVLSQVEMVQGALSASYKLEAGA